MVEQVSRVENLAVDVELKLASGAIADPDRRRTPIALEMAENLLGQVRSAIDA
jgi:hypothetical protein